MTHSESRIVVRRITVSEHTTSLQELLRDPKSEDPVSVEVAAEVTGVWRTSDARALHGIRDLHIWSDSYVEGRLSWRPNVPVTVLELRCSKLRTAIELQNKPDLWGCFSFVDVGPVSDEIWSAAAPVLSEKSFGRLQAELRAAFEASGVQELET